MIATLKNTSAALTGLGEVEFTASEFKTLLDDCQRAKPTTTHID
jgi:hypothetical protein